MWLFRRTITSNCDSTCCWSCDWKETLSSDSIRQRSTTLLCHTWTLILISCFKSAYWQSVALFIHGCNRHLRWDWISRHRASVKTTTAAALIKMCMSFTPPPSSPRRCFHWGASEWMWAKTLWPWSHCWRRSCSEEKKKTRQTVIQHWNRIKNKTKQKQKPPSVACPYIYIYIFFFCHLTITSGHGNNKHQVLGRSLWAKEGNSDNSPVFEWASPDSAGPQEVNKLCVCSSPADVCLAEEEEGAGRGQAWGSRVNNRPHCRVAAVALQTVADAEEGRTRRGSVYRGTLHALHYKALSASLPVWDQTYCCSWKAQCLTLMWCCHLLTSWPFLLWV